MISTISCYPAMAQNLQENYSTPSGSCTVPWPTWWQCFGSRWKEISYEWVIPPGGRDNVMGLWVFLISLLCGWVPSSQCVIENTCRHHNTLRPVRFKAKGDVEHSEPISNNAKGVLHRPPSTAQSVCQRSVSDGNTQGRKRGSRHHLRF